ncbi:MAG: hypothetical protein FJW37_00585 [Acidobacteria bacterium]|nr:hypothetical protein [Acidobacteriota bacterium]
MRRLSILALAAAAALAQHQHPKANEKPPALLPGLGNHHFPIATASPEAQKFFDQGLTLLYGFNRYEALRSFRRAAELDPKALMPRWGMAMALGPHINMDLDGDVNQKEACEILRAANAVSLGAPERERAYAETAASRCLESDPHKYQQALRGLASRYPDDLDAATLLAESLMIPARWRWWTPEGQPAEGMEEAIRALEGVLRRNPEHPGANHFYIHAVEMSPTPERAVLSAQRLMGIVPAAGHLVHMPGHIWLLLGEFELAAATNERAAEVDRQYFAATGVTSGYAGYYVHNLHFVAYARQMQGRREDATRAAETVVREARPFTAEMPMMVDAFLPYLLFVQARFARWDDILAAQPPDAKLHASAALHHFGRALALNAKGRREEAAAGQRAFEAARKKLPADWMWLNNKAADILAIAAEVLAARLAASPDAALAHWQRAVELQDRLVYEEPPAWYYPIRESLGGALLGSGRAAEAEAVFREGLRRGPRNGRMLFGLRESLKAQGKQEAAAAVGREFEKAWSRADVELKLAEL